MGFGDFSSQGNGREQAQFQIAGRQAALGQIAANLEPESPEFAQLYLRHEELGAMSNLLDLQSIAGNLEPGSQEMALIQNNMAKLELSMQLMELQSTVIGLDPNDPQTAIIRNRVANFSELAANLLG